MHASLTHGHPGQPCTAWLVNTLRPRQNGRHFTNDTVNRLFLNENARSWIKNSLKFVPKRPINNIPALVQIIDWRRPGDKPLSEPVMVSLLTHICVTRPQWIRVLLVFTWVSIQPWNVNNASVRLCYSSWWIIQCQLQCLCLCMSEVLCLYQNPCWLNPITFLIYLLLINFYFSGHI